MWNTKGVEHAHLNLTSAGSRGREGFSCIGKDSITGPELWSEPSGAQAVTGLPQSRPHTCVHYVRAIGSGSTASDNQGDDRVVSCDGVGPTVWYWVAGKGL